MRRIICLLLLIVLVSPPGVDFTSHGQDPAGADQDPQNPFSVDNIEQQLEGPLDVETIVATSGWIQSAGIVDWLGPLAPVALSPFFGVTCLSGLALWGPEWVTDGALLGAKGPLKSEILFGVFLLLTVLTSVPRLTKVSKPLAQSVDRLETYAVIVILLIIKVASSMESSGDGPVALVQLGIVSFTIDSLLAIAMVINILVINSVKFFFEFMVWLTPVPLLDAVFEICNKSLCVALMAIYAFSPTMATIINLSMLVFAAIVLRWINRRVRFYRSMILDPVIAKLWRGFGTPKRTELIVFPTSEVGPFKAKSRLRLLPQAAEGDRAEGSGWILEEANWWMPSKTHVLACNEQPQVCCGWVTNSVSVTDADGGQTHFSFSRRYNAETLQQLVEQLGMQMSDDSVPGSALQETIQHSLDKIAGEFA